jgi:hypothetical protein
VNANELRAKAHELALRGGVLSPGDQEVILEASRRWPPDPPTLADLDKAVAVIAARLRPRPAFEASPAMETPFDSRISETEAALEDARAALEDARVALEAAKTADVVAFRERSRRGAAYRGPSEAATEEAVIEAREAYEAADRAWVRFNSRLHALSMARTRWRSEHA